MSATKPTTSQIRFTSRYTGEHLLDTYLEAMEKGGRSVPDILDDLFDESGQLIADIEFRFNPSTYYLEYRHGQFLDSTSGWQTVDEFRFLEEKGEYTGGINYKIYDLVTNNNSFYVCKEAHVAPPTIDPTKWNTLFDATYIDSIHDDITTKHTEVEADRLEVETRQSDIIERQNNIIQRQSDIDTAATTHINNITTEGNTQVTRVQTEGTIQVSLATTQADSASSSATAASAAATTAEGHRDTCMTIAQTITGAMIDGGTWDASTNTLPAVPSMSTMWKITAAGTLDTIAYGVGDTLVYTTANNAWYKIDNTESVTSVNGHHGVVNLTHADVGALPASTTVTDLGGYTTTAVDNAINTAQSTVQGNLDNYISSNNTAVATAQSTADAKVPEAPNDGKQYARQNNSWNEVDGLPDQTGHASKFLTTDGTNASWGEVDLATILNRLATLETKTQNMSIDGTNNTITIFSGEVQATDVSIGN